MKMNFLQEKREKEGIKKEGHNLFKGTNNGQFN